MLTKYMCYMVYFHVPLFVHTSEGELDRMHARQLMKVIHMKMCSHPFLKVTSRIKSDKWGAER